MSLTLMYITNNPEIAIIAENSGVDWIFVDLEINGKEERQGHLDTVISRHSIEDVKIIKSVLTKSKLLVRINPIFGGSMDEIDRVVKDGAEIVMLPYFKTKSEVETFVTLLNGRAKACLLLETPEAVKNISSILDIDGLDYIHIGLNDLHLGYGKKFMFELLVDGTVEKLCNEFKKKKISYGFGGIAQLGKGDLISDRVIVEHYRLGSSMAILSRTFCDANKLEDMNELRTVFEIGVAEIRDFEKSLKYKDFEFFTENKQIVKETVNSIVNKLQI